MYYKGKSTCSKSAGQVILAHSKVTAASLWLTVVALVVIALGASARNALLQQSAVKVASDRVEANVNAYNSSAAPIVSNKQSTMSAKQSKFPMFSAPKGMVEGNKVIAQASVSAGGGAVYDAEKRIVKIVETRGGSVTSTKQFVWAGDQLCEERDGTGAVTKRFFSLGEQIAGTNYYYSRDQIGSVRELTNGSGVVQSQYGYGPWGEVSKLAGSGPDSDMQYAGMYIHQPSGLNLAVDRAYSASQGRFISRDPMDDQTFGMTPESPEPNDPGEMMMAGSGHAVLSPNMLTIRNVSSNPVIRARVAQTMMASVGPAGSQNVNGYAYVNNNPISYSDPSGLMMGRPVPPPPQPRPGVCYNNDLYDACVKKCQREMQEMLKQ